MLYNLLKDIRRQLGAKTPLTAEEQCLLERIDHAVPQGRRCRMVTTRRGTGARLSGYRSSRTGVPRRRGTMYMPAQRDRRGGCRRCEAMALVPRQGVQRQPQTVRSGCGPCLQCRGGQTLGRKGFPCRGVGNYSMGRGIRNDTCWYGLGRRRLPPCHR